MNYLKNKLTALILVVVLIVLLARCDNYKNSGNDLEKPNYKIIVIDSCEYLGFQVAYGYWTYTHKGDCKNPIHKHSR